MTARRAVLSTGQPAGIPELTTETSQTFANPDGSLAAEMSAAPVRARQADGSWGSIDFTLHRTAVGTIQPVAAPYGAALSAGGGGPLVKLTRSGKSLSLTWPNGALPAPVLSGDVATYPNVLPDVDLRVTLDAHGFSEVLVVKNRQAAANPALAKMRFTMATTDVTVEGDGNTFSAVDSGGNEIFGSGSPMMWDSGVQATSAKGLSAPVRHEAAMPITVSPDTIEVTPNRALLTAADTVYPLYIDPSVSVSRLARLAAGDAATSVAFNADGTILAVSSAAHDNVQLWDIRNPGTPTSVGDPLDGPVTDIYQITFHPAGNELAAGSVDGTIWFWDLADPRKPERKAVVTAPSAVMSISYSGDGAVLAAGTRDQKVRVRRTDPESTIRWICATTGDHITEAEWRQLLPRTAYSPAC